MDAIPIVIFWALALWGMISRRPVLLYLFFCSMAFGAFAVVPPELTVGLTLTPTYMVAVLMIMRQLAGHGEAGAWLSGALQPSRMLLLFLFWLVAVITTYYMPRLFEGQVTVIPMRLTYHTRGEPLMPTVQNLSQMVYLTISVASVFAFARLLRPSSQRQVAIHAVVAGSVVVIITGVLDYASQFVPLEQVLEPFRTATYALMTNDEILGSKRVVGLMSEASAYGGLCLSFLASLYFFRRCIAEPRLRERIVPAIMLVLVLMIWLSTSSAAYVGLAMLAVAMAAEWMWRAIALHRHSRRREGLWTEFVLLSVVCTAVGVVFVVVPSVFDPIVAMVDKMVFQKTGTASFEERSMWTQVSWDALWATFGLGVGVGGTRASNGVVALIASTGLLGGAFYLAFLFQTFTRRAAPVDPVGNAFMAAAFWAFLPGFVASLLAGTSPNFGVFNAFMYGLIIALARVGSRAHAVGFPYRVLPLHVSRRVLRR